MSSTQETLLFNRLLAAAGAALFSSSSLKWCGKGGDGYIEALPGSYMGCSMLRVNMGRRVPSFFNDTAGLLMITSVLAAPASLYYYWYESVEYQSST